MVSMVWPHMEVQWLHGEHGIASHGSTMVTWWAWCGLTWKYNGYMVSMVWPHMEVQWLHGEHGMASHGRRLFQQYGCHTCMNNTY